MIKVVAALQTSLVNTLRRCFHQHLSYKDALADTVNVKQQQAAWLPTLPSPSPHSDVTSSRLCLLLQDVRCHRVEDDELNKELCMRRREARHSKTLADIAGLSPYNTAPSNPGLFSCWHLEASVWCTPAELKCAHRGHTTASLPTPLHSPCLPWHFLSLMEKEKNGPLQNDKWSAREHIYTSQLAVMESSRCQRSDASGGCVVLTGLNVCCLPSTRMRIAQIKLAKGSRNHQIR